LTPHEIKPADEVYIMSTRPFAGLKVIEYGEYISAPYCTRLLAGLGADVIKVEKAGGDEARINGPFPQDIPHPEKSGLYLSLNANKKGVTLNLDKPQGKDVFKKLIANADVLVENNIRGCMAGLGLGYEVLKAINPKLVMVSITPFGQTGPIRTGKPITSIPAAPAACPSAPATPPGSL
jgi:crotonobetainyl-CoA:carnitine CoA-transferase CaiB-like acyl-CoA transferase